LKEKEKEKNVQEKDRLGRKLRKRKKWKGINKKKRKKRKWKNY